MLKENSGVDISVENVESEQLLNKRQRANSVTTAESKAPNTDCRENLNYGLIINTHH